MTANADFSSGAYAKFNRRKYDFASVSCKCARASRVQVLQSGLFSTAGYSRAARSKRDRSMIRICFRWIVMMPAFRSSLKAAVADSR